jgi:hypothetical protein
MKIAIFSRDSNPAIDSPLFYASKDRFLMLVATGQIQMLTKRTAQYLCELRDPIKRAKAVKPVFIDGGDNGRYWRIVHQTTPGFGPGQPEYQLVP